MYSALTIANFFIRKGLQEKITVTPMKLQKLIYFAHGWHLAFFDRALIKEDVQAWPYGPVIPAIYHVYKTYGNATITQNTDEGIKGLSTETIEFLDFIWSTYKKFSPIHLSNITHLKDSPWDQVRQGHKGDLRRGIPMRNELIKRYFQKIYQTN